MIIWPNFSPNSFSSTPCENIRHVGVSVKRWLWRHRGWADEKKKKGRETPPYPRTTCWRRCDACRTEIGNTCYNKQNMLHDFIIVILLCRLPLWTTAVTHIRQHATVIRVDVSREPVSTIMAAAAARKITSYVLDRWP